MSESEARAKASGSSSPPFWPLVEYSLGRIRYALLLLPLAVGAIFALLVSARVIPNDPVAFAIAEDSAPVVLSIALLAAVARLCRLRNGYMLWLSCLVTVLLAREIHFRGTTAATYFALVVLGVVGWRRYRRMAPYLGSRNVMTWLALVFFSYFLSQSIDHHWFEFIPDEPVFGRMTEEFLELIGHSCALCLVLFSREDETLDLSPLDEQPRHALLTPWNATAVVVAVLGIALWFVLLTDVRLLSPSHGVVYIVVIAGVTALLRHSGRGRASPLLMNATTLPVAVATVAFLVLLTTNSPVIVRDVDPSHVLQRLQAPKYGRIALVESRPADGPGRTPIVKITLRYAWVALERDLIELQPEWEPGVVRSRPIVEWTGSRKLQRLDRPELIRIPRITIERAIAAWLSLAAVGFLLTRRLLG